MDMTTKNLISTSSSLKPDRKAMRDETEGSDYVNRIRIPEEYRERGDPFLRKLETFQK